MRWDKFNIVLGLIILSLFFMNAMLGYYFPLPLLPFTFAFVAWLIEPEDSSK